jgi:hypothetical protein
VRETAYAIWAINEIQLISGANDRLLNEIRAFVYASTRWLERQKNVRGEYCHYEDEVWDTALVLLATHESLPVLRDGMVRWLVQKRLNKHGAFDGDIWETCFAVLALLEVSREKETLRKSILWLCNLRNESGLVVSPAYTSLVGMCIQKYLAKYGVEGEELLTHYNTGFLRALVSFAPEQEFQAFPYADELWGNSYTLLYLLRGRVSGQVNFDNAFLAKHMEQYTEYIDRVELSLERLCRIEDLALTVQMLDVLAVATCNQYLHDLAVSSLTRKIAHEILMTLPPQSFSYSGMFEIDGSTWVIRLFKSTRKKAAIVIAVIGLPSSLVGFWPYLKTLFAKFF